jgi:Xaa-Pro dipeptidase
MNHKRLSLLQNLMLIEKLDILALNAGVDLEYFTGLKFHLSERPAVLLIPSDGKPVFIFPEFELEKAKQSLIELDLYPFPEDTAAWSMVFSNAANKLDLAHKKIGVAPESMRFLELDLIQTAAGHNRFMSAAEIIKSLKIQKSNEEVLAIRKAISIAEKALLALLPQIKPGVSEKWLANQLVIHLLNEGSDPDLPFEPIIASGPNSANPHSVPTDRKLQSSDALIIDWGARFDGYISDLTRSFLIAGENPLMSQIAAVVLEANKSAIAAVRPNVAANEVDNAARNVISKAGFGDAFTHRTGHGIGLLAHEDPYISQANTSLLKTGMVFTIEPGIYLPGRGGIRIEDNILINDTGCETLTTLPREVKII